MPIEVRIVPAVSPEVILRDAFRRKFESQMSKPPRFLGADCDKKRMVLRYEDRSGDWDGWPLGPPPGVEEEDPVTRLIWDWPPTTTILGITEDGIPIGPSKVAQNEIWGYTEAEFTSTQDTHKLVSMILIDAGPKEVRDLEEPLEVKLGFVTTFTWEPSLEVGEAEEGTEPVAGSGDWMEDEDWPF